MPLEKNIPCENFLCGLKKVFSYKIFLWCNSSLKNHFQDKKEAEAHTVSMFWALALAHIVNSFCFVFYLVCFLRFYLFILYVSFLFFVWFRASALSFPPLSTDSFEPTVNLWNALVEMLRECLWYRSTFQSFRWSSNVVSMVSNKSDDTLEITQREN